MNLDQFKYLCHVGCVVTSWFLKQEVVDSNNYFYKNFVTEFAATENLMSRSVCEFGIISTIETYRNVQKYRFLFRFVSMSSKGLLILSENERA